MTGKDSSLPADFEKVKFTDEDRKKLEVLAGLGAPALMEYLFYGGMIAFLMVLAVLFLLLKNDVFTFAVLIGFIPVLIIIMYAVNYFLFGRKRLPARQDLTEGCKIVKHCRVESTESGIAEGDMYYIVRAGGLTFYMDEEEFLLFRKGNRVIVEYAPRSREPLRIYLNERENPSYSTIKTGMSGNSVKSFRDFITGKIEYIILAVCLVLTPYLGHLAYINIDRTCGILYRSAASRGTVVECEAFWFDDGYFFAPVVEYEAPPPGNSGDGEKLRVYRSILRESALSTMKGCTTLIGSAMKVRYDTANPLNATRYGTRIPLVTYILTCMYVLIVLIGFIGADYILIRIIRKL